MGKKRRKRNNYGNKPRPDPTPKEIKEATAEIRENWSEKDHQRRYQKQDNIRPVDYDKPVRIYVEED